MKVLILFLVMFTQLLLAQQKDSIHNMDCLHRKVLNTLKPDLNFFPAPEGYGDIREFMNNPSSGDKFIEQENFSAWYEFETKIDADLIFSIIPDTAKDDYDFALYQYTNDDFCKDLIQKKIQPVRTNFSRNDLELKGITGLDIKAKNIFVGQGIGPVFSKSIAVKKEDKFILVLNNVYKNGSGHRIFFDYNVPLSIEGMVELDDSTTARNSNVKLTNTITGDVLAETVSDSITGAYELDFKILKSQIKHSLQIEITKDNHFFRDTLIKAFHFVNKIKKSKVRLKIKKLKKGERITINNILFYGNSPKPLERSLPSMYSLYKTMRKNKNLKIKIEGHTNGCINGKNFSDKLSKARAETIGQYLEDQKIESVRMQLEGFGCKKMLYSENSPYNHLNRRVEIMILEL